MVSRAGAGAIVAVGSTIAILTGIDDIVATKILNALVCKIALSVVDRFISIISVAQTL